MEKEKLKEALQILGSDCVCTTIGCIELKFSKKILQISALKHISHVQQKGQAEATDGNICR